jgi:hypothetical protein
MVMEQKAVLNPNGMSDKKNTLGKYENTSPTLSGDNVQNIPTLVKSKKTYHAIIKAKGVEKIQRFRICDKHGNFDLYNYAHLLEASFRNGVFILTTTTRIFTLTGKNLEKIADLLDDTKIKSMHEFNSDTQELPTEENAIIIESIDRTE